MKLLVITHNPERASFRQRIAVYVDALKANGIDCEIAKLPRCFWSRRKLFLYAKDFDGVFLHKKTLNFFDARRLREFARKVIYDFDDAIMFNDKRPEAIHRKRQTYFCRTVRLADLVIAGNPYLADHARQLNPNVEILPTGLDTSSTLFETKNLSDDKIRLVWIGSKTTLCYLEAIAPAIEKISSQFENVILRIISDRFPNLRNIRIEKHPWSLDTEALELAGCDIGLAPLPDNSFTRGKCGFKILQYACASLPVVASPVGINREYVRNGISGFHAVNTGQWIDNLTALIKDPQLRRTMGRQGRQFAQEFDVSIIGKRLCEILRKCLSNTR